jgi:hypothetical protein
MSLRISSRRARGVWMPLPLSIVAALAVAAGAV